MTLTGRLTAFLVATVTVVLIGFSLALYLLTQAQLFRELDARANASRGMLFASVEVEPNGLEWDPKAEYLQHIPGEELQWAALDEKGLVGGSAQASQLSNLLPTFPASEGAVDVTLNNAPWRIVTQSMRHPKPEMVVTSSEPGMIRHRQLNFIVAVSITPVQETLHTLAIRLLAITCTTMLIVALLAKWVGRQALLPLRKMTKATQSIRADDLTARLPVPKAKDELHELGNAFNLLLSRVHEAFERQKNFTSQASHQLRTPLTAILGQMELALRRNREVEDYKKTLSLVKDQATRLHEMVEMLLFLARADGDARLPHLDTINLGSWLPLYVNQFWSNHPRFGDMHLHVPNNTALSVSVHPELLGQAIGNLIDNALKYSDSGTPVHLRLMLQDSRVILTVEDRGHGIDSEDIPHLFSPFFRSDVARQKGITGIGLGLSITARIIQTFNGHASFDNNDDQGGIFSISLQRMR